MSNTPIPTSINPASFEKTIDGKAVHLYMLKNNTGMHVAITNYGGRVVSLIAPDKQGNMADVVMGFESIEGYLNAKGLYYGALIGRCGNRIAKGKFSLNGKDYTLATNNNGINHLHGGKKGFSAVVWEAEQTSSDALELRYLSVDGEEGYPGNLDVKVTYTLTEANELRIEYTATTDHITIVNLTHHSFFNLSGDMEKSINDHILTINADKYTPIGEGLIPMGEIARVDGTPFDFRVGKAIHTDLDTKSDQLEYARGYDHNFALNKSNPDVNGLTWAASISEPISGRTMEVWTNEPGMQFYGGNFLNGTDTGKGGKPYQSRTAFCLETQHFPDSPHHDNFPPIILHPGETYRSICVYRFSAG